MLGEPAPVAAPRYGAAPDSLMTPPACKGSFDNGNASADELFFAAQAPPTDAPSAATDPPVSGDEWDMLAGVGCTPPSRAEVDEGSGFFDGLDLEGPQQETEDPRRHSRESAGSGGILDPCMGGDEEEDSAEDPASGRGGAAGVPVGGVSVMAGKARA